MAKYGRRSRNFTDEIFSNLFFWWLKDLFWYGRKNFISADNLYEALPEEHSEPLGDTLESAWNDEIKTAKSKGKRPKLWRAIVNTYRISFLKFSMLLFAYDAVKIFQPTLLGLLMSYFRASSTTTTSQAHLYAAALVISIVLQAMFVRHGYFGLHRVGMRARIACSSLVYRKITRLSCKAAGKTSGGAIINLLSNDVAYFEMLSAYFPYLLITPFHLIVATYLIWCYVGSAALVGIALTIVQSIPLQIFLYRVTSKLRTKLSSLIDKRISLISEVISGIRTIKMYVWERFFEELVYSYRRNEIKVYLKRACVATLIPAIGAFVYRVSAFFTILTYTLQNGFISPEKIVPVAQHLFNLRIKSFTHVIRVSVDVNVSLKRIEEFLLLDELESNVKKLNCFNNNNINVNTSVSIVNASASWDRESQDKNLQEISLEVKVNELCAIVGPLGSGKSSLLKLILGELQPISGEIGVRGTISYASQEPWLFTGSIRENIVFGETYDESRYKQVTEACALEEDFERLPYGDKTFVGERGAALSGGQCARINMARAVYRDADVYLFDDPFSATDTNVINKLFDDCINGLLKNKTRILVTHSLQHLKNDDQVILLDKDGRVEYRGSFADFKAKTGGRYFCYALPTLNQKSEKEVESKKGNNDDKVPLKVTACRLNNNNNNSNETTDEPRETEELIAKGKIKSSLYLKYILASDSNCTLFLLLVFFIIALLSSSGFDYWLVAWTKQAEKAGQSSSSYDYVKVLLYVCGSLLVIVVLTSVLKNVLFYKVMLNASKNIHNSMFRNLMRTPLRFFEVNPSGRILNRFSKDTGAVDEILPRVIFDAVDFLFITAAIVIPVLVADLKNALPMLIVSYVLFKLSAIYVPTALAIKRVEGAAKSPVLSLAASTLSGLLTIRSCKAESIVRRIFDSRQDQHTSAHFLMSASNSAFSLWMELLVNGLFVLAVYRYLCLEFDGERTAGDVGLVLMQLLKISMMLQYAIRQVSETMAQMANVERMMQFTQLEQEGPYESVYRVTIEKTWPSRGELKFENMYLKYNDEEEEEPVLKNLNLKIESRMKVGIVGRTGAGKSSLISALLRLSKTEGRLVIDGLDVETIGLSDLRSNISVIPQEPILFSATLRTNLDPLNEFDDASLYSALEDVELNKVFQSLDQTISRAGADLSAGQRQLICLARAIVKKNKILVLDEATANVDPTTDDLIQKTIRIKFEDCTVLTIAHRLNTIMDSDKVLVMHAGEAVEFDVPYLLLQNNESYFADIVRQTGNSMAQHLKTIAQEAYYRKNNPV